MRNSNYEISRERAQQQFLDYDQETMIRKFALRSDEAYLYIAFFGRQYRISRTTGAVEGSDDGFVTVIPGDFNVSLSLYDLLCCSRPDCCLTGEFVMTNSLPGTVQTASSGVGSGMYRSDCLYFDGRTELLARACRALGGIPDGKGDVAYRLTVFEFMPMRLEFWQSDDEFEPELRLMWDRNVQSYMHYETLWYAAGHLLRRLRELIGEMEER